MLLVVLQHLALVWAGGIVLCLLDSISDLGHELVKVTSSHVNGDVVVKMVALEIWHARRVYEL